MKKESFILRKSIFLLLIIEITLFFVSCATIPKPTLEEIKLYGIKIGSINEILDMIDTGQLTPYEINLTSGKGKSINEHFGIREGEVGIGTLRMLGDRLLFRQQDLGEENVGYLRNENPILSFPITGDTVETDTFVTFFNIWKFDANKDQQIDVILRSFSTFPSGMFFPYFILINIDGNVLARQENINCIEAEAFKSESMTIWLEDFDIPKTSTYYLIILSDMKNAHAKQHFVRLGKERYPAKTIYYNNWGIVYENPSLPYSPGSMIGKYELIVKIF